MSDHDLTPEEWQERLEKIQANAEHWVQLAREAQASDQKWSEAQDAAENLIRQGLGDEPKSNPFQRQIRKP